MSDSVYTLAWPPALFAWEGANILRTASGQDLRGCIEHLLREASVDESAADSFVSEFPANQEAASIQGWGVPAGVTPSQSDRIRAWLQRLISDDRRLRPYQAPVYFAERQSGSFMSGSDRSTSFAADFVELVEELAEEGYFPKILPKLCEDDRWADLPDVSKEIRRATRQTVSWPLNSVSAQLLPELTVYSLVEYFHDQAQRPRLAEWHSWNECGYHYSVFNSESGGAVYRWRVNELLASHKAPLRLGSLGDERGRLIHHFSAEQDALLTEELEAKSADPANEVAHAIRMFRARDANNIDKRAALALLYKRLEPKRKYLERKTTKGDVDDIFNIANRYHIRHSVGQQFNEEREEYLDWMFWNFLSMVRLLDALEKRQAAGEP